MRFFIIIAVAALTPASVSAQTIGSPLGGGLGSLLGGALPNLAQTGAGNAAGVLGYCVKNKLTNSMQAGNVLGRLTGQKNITESPAYTAGQSGILQTGNGGLSVANLRGQLKNKVCDLVLKRAQSFL